MTNAETSSQIVSSPRVAKSRSLSSTPASTSTVPATSATKVSSSGVNAQAHTAATNVTSVMRPGTPRCTVSPEEVTTS